MQIQIMGGPCAALGCRSGSAKNKREKTFQPEPVIMFKVPEDQNLRKKWLRSLKRFISILFLDLSFFINITALKIYAIYQG